MLIFCGSICILKGCFMLHVKTNVINCHETVDSRGLQIDIAKKVNRIYLNRLSLYTLCAFIVHKSRLNVHKLYDLYDFLSRVTLPLLYAILSDIPHVDILSLSSFVPFKSFIFQYKYTIYRVVSLSCCTTVINSYSVFNGSSNITNEVYNKVRLSFSSLFIDL